MRAKKILSILLVLALMLTNMPVGLVNAAALPTPELVSPTNNHTSTSPPVFSWKAVTGATSYKFELSQKSDSTFSQTPLVTITTTKNLSATLDKQLSDGTYYWRISAKDSSGVFSPSSEIRSFDISWASVPIPIDPLNNRTIIYPDEPLVLRWNPAAGASEYEVQIASSAEFANILWPSTSIKTASLSISPYNVANNKIPYGPQCFWRVRSVAKGADGRDLFGNWSEIGSFNVQWFQKPTLLSPSNGLETQIDPELCWEPVPGAVEYELEVSPNDDFSSHPYNHFKKTYNTSYTPETSLVNERFNWRVRGMDSRGIPGDWSEIRSFSKNWAPPVQRVNPSEGQHVQSVRFEWAPVTGASHYQVQASTDQNSWELSSPYLVFNSSTNHTSFTPPKGTKIPANTTIYWRVKPLDATSGSGTIEGKWSNETGSSTNPWSFVRSFLTPGYQSPGNGDSINPPDLQWSSLQFAGSYKVEAKSGSQTWSYTTDNLSATPENTSTVKPGSSYTWWITPYDADNVNGAIAGSLRSFTVGEEPEGSTSINLLSPTNGSSFNIMPTFKWTPYTGAAGYRIFCMREGEAVWWDLVNFEKSTANCIASYTSYTPKKILTSANYTWYVQPVDKSGADIGTPSGYGAFTVTDPSIVTMGQPAHGSLEPKTPTFTWSPVPNAAYYHIKIFADKSLTTLYDEAKTVFTSWTPTKSYGDNSVGTGYYWYVYSVDGSERYSRLIEENVKSFEKHSVMPELLSPTDGADNTSNRPVLKWQSVEGAASYQVQVATDPNFGSDTIKINRDTVDGPNLNIGRYGTSPRTLAEGTYYWRVRAKDNSGVKASGGNYLDWSLVRSFKVVMPKPTLDKPADNAMSDHSILFTWNPVDGAESYEIQISNSNTFSGSTPIRIYGNAYIPTTLYAPGTYYWRVRIKDPSGNPGSWSGTRTFTRTKQPATVSISPSNQSKISDNLAFEWQGLPSAASYEVVVSTSSNFGTKYDGKITNLTAWAPLLTSPSYSAGTYYWRVAPRDSSNNVGVFSQTVTFTSERPASGGSSDGGGGGGGGGGTEEKPALLSPPTSLKAVGAETNITLAWNQVVSSNLKGYNVYRADSSAGPWAKLNTTIVSLKTYSDNTAATGKTYYYGVTAIDTDNKETSKSNIVSAARSVVLKAVVFSDVSSYHWAGSFIQSLASRNILGGYSDGTFRPERTITRAEFAKVIVTAKGWQLVSPTSPSFSDVKRTHWAYRYIETAKQHGVLGGYADGIFKPGNNINRAEICKMVVSGGGYSLASSGASFNDIQNSHWAYSFVITAKNNEIVGGYADGAFRPNGFTTRAEASKMVYKMLGLTDS